jgi:aspartate racemase
VKVIGLIGGMSWESTVPYYRLINEEIMQRLGGLHSARIILYSVDFHDVECLQRAEDWDAAGAMLAGVAQAVEQAGADFLVLCTNTMHRVAPAVEAAVRVPLLHIVDATAEQIRSAGVSTVGLLGTRFTMEQNFYKDRLQHQHGLRVLTPGAQDRAIVHRIIYQELCVGSIVEQSRLEFRRVIAELVSRGAEAIALACTEIMLLVDQTDSAVPLFDTTSIHARKAAELALSA